jgi:hypothetical protein
MVAHLLYGTPDASGSHWRTLENIHYRVITEARARGLDYREMRPNLIKGRSEGAAGRHWTAKYAQRRWYYLNRVQRQPKK